MSTHGSTIRTVRDTLGRFIYMKPSDVLILAEFVIGTHCPEPLLPVPFIDSMTGDCGKSQLLRIMKILSNLGVYSKAPTIAGLRRRASKGAKEAKKNGLTRGGYTFLLDEADLWLFDEKRIRDHALIINGIFDGDDAEMLMAEHKEGGGFSSGGLEVSGLGMVIAGKDILTADKLGAKTWDTVRTRSIPMFLEPAPESFWAKGHPIYKGNEARFKAELVALHWEINEFAKRHHGSFADYDPDMHLPNGRLLFNRARDKFRMMFHIADLDGDEWPGAIRAVAQGSQQAATPDDKKILISACKAIMESRNIEAIYQDDLLTYITNIDHPFCRSIKTVDKLNSEKCLAGIKQIGKSKPNWCKQYGTNKRGWKLSKIRDAHKVYCNVDVDEFVARLIADKEEEDENSTGGHIPQKPVISLDANEINGLTRYGGVMEPLCRYGDGAPDHSEPTHAGADDLLGAAVAKARADNVELAAEVAAMNAENMRQMVELAHSFLVLDDAEFAQVCSIEGVVELRNVTELFEQAAAGAVEKHEAHLLRKAMDRIAAWGKLYPVNGKPNGAWKGHDDE